MFVRRLIGIGAFCMRRDPRSFLWDINEAADLVSRFIGNVELAEYLADPMRRAAVERQLQNLGEALVQLEKTDAQIAGRVPDHREIIGFRHALVHGYKNLNHARVWHTAVEDLPPLRAAIVALMTELGPPQQSP
jgi:uncharacterized protein with HEPN domain